MWKERLQNVYDSFTEWNSYALTYGLHIRLGFASTIDAWEANPMCQGSTIPADYGLSPMGEYRFIAAGGPSPLYGVKPYYSIRENTKGLQILIRAIGGLTWINVNPSDITASVCP